MGYRGFFCRGFFLPLVVSWRIPADWLARCDPVLLEIFMELDRLTCTRRNTQERHFFLAKCDESHYGCSFHEGHSSGKLSFGP